MNSESTQPAPAPAAQPCRGTQIVLLVSLLMMGAGTGLFLWNEIRAKSTEVTFARKIVTDFRTNNEPHVKEFITELQAFGRSNPDFNPILAKYKLLAGPAVGSPPAAPAAPVAPPKK